MENPPLEGVFPIEDGDFSNVHVGFLGVCTSLFQPRWKHQLAIWQSHHHFKVGWWRFARGAMPGVVEEIHCESDPRRHGGQRWWIWWCSTNNMEKPLAELQWREPEVSVSFSKAQVWKFHKMWCWDSCKGSGPEARAHLRGRLWLPASS